MNLFKVKTKYHCADDSKYSILFGSTLPKSLYNSWISRIRFNSFCNVKKSKAMQAYYIMLANGYSKELEKIACKDLNVKEYYNRFIKK